MPFMLFGCANQKNLLGQSAHNITAQSSAQKTKPQAARNEVIINDSTFVNLKTYSNEFIYDMRYATTDNFLKAQVYDCAECYLRLKTVKALVKANEAFIKNLRDRKIKRSQNESRLHLPLLTRHALYERACRSGFRG